ncbi:response regulator [Halotia branconii]|uniref:histidine kinase n=1 Tax=Halotia branconii CENA392 TaxID=1539056 RepID=A0AAJ6PAG9_9CYAN|nr:response regulator [Halotia branconii]WGV26864.1 response regulator [Halotia branconii CENA392]
MLPEQQQRILGYFIEEARDHLNTIEQGLLNLESTLNDPEMVNEVFRAAHSIKGGAAMLGLSSIQHTSHRLEDCFKVLKEHPVKIDQKLESLFLGVSDTLKALLEHLSGPFGLSEEAANNLMSEAEPVFKWLYEHLETLVQQGSNGVVNGTATAKLQPASADSVSTLTEIFLRQDIPLLEEDTQTTTTEINFSAPSQETRTPVASREKDWGEFQSQVLQALREMLQLFKQKATPESRQKLQQCCHQLVTLGEKWNLPNWCGLCQAAASAIANPENTYLTLAKIVITEIKQAQELVHQSREAEIAISQQLEALLSFPEIDLLEITTDLLEERLATVTEPLITSEPNLSEPILPLQTDNLVSDATVLQPTDSVTSFTELSEQLNIEHIAENDISEAASVSLFFSNEDDVAVTNKHNDHNGPEVGLAELNTLADLFEGETPELDETWQQEEVLDIKNVSELGIELSDHDNDEVDSDLADFLSLDEDISSDESQISTSKKEELDLLFGDKILEQENLKSQDLSISTDALEKLAEISSELPQSPEEINQQDTMDDLLAIGLDENLALPTEEVTQPETEIIASIEISINQPSSLDDLFIETTNIENLEEINANNSLELKPNVPQSDAFSLDNLFAATEENTILPTNESEIGDLFDAPTTTEIEFSQTDDDLSNFWNQETDAEQQSEFDLVLEQDIAKALEESLFAATSSSEIFDDKQSTSSPTANFDLEEFDISFEQPEQPLDLILPPDTGDDFFGDSTTSDLTISSTVGDDNISLQEISNFSQEPETLDFIPEFTNLSTDESVVASSQTLAESEIDLFHPLGDSSDENLEEKTTTDHSTYIQPFDDLFKPETEQPATLEKNSDSSEIIEDSLEAIADLPETEQLATLENSSDSSEIIEDSLEAIADLPETEQLATLENSSDSSEIIEDSLEAIADLPETEQAATQENLSDSSEIIEDSLEAIADLPETEQAATQENLSDSSEIIEDSLEAIADFSEIDDLLTSDTEQPATQENPSDSSEIVEDSIEAIADFSEIDDLLTSDTEQPATLENNSDSSEIIEDSLEAIADFSEIDDLLTSELATDTTEDDALADLDFGEFGLNLETDENLAEVSQQNETYIQDEFADLEALLKEDVSPNTKPSFIAEEDFAALEALLGADDDEQVTAKSHDQLSQMPQLRPETTASPVTDEFGDLEKLLAEADQTISHSSPAKQNIGKIPRPSARRTAKFEETMKVPVKQLDDMSNLVGELVVNRNTLEQDHERMRQSLDNLLVQVQQLSDVGARMQELYERSLLEASLLASRKTKESPKEISLPADDADTDRGFSELEMDRFTPFHTLSQEMIELIVRVRESASDIDFVTEETERVARQFRQVTTQLQEGLTKARMVPFSQTIDRLRRGVRDNAIKYGKQVELIIEGGDTLIDKMILDHLTDPLTHMLNNAIAHGIEMPEVRQAAGKQPVGVITIRAFHQGNQTIISVGDDGAGIDTEGIKAKAIKLGMITAEQAKTISRMEVYDLLFQSGFSIKDKADEISGRGVGMDVVRSEISEIRGTVNTDSIINKGTTFTIRLPLTLSICKALCCVSDKARVAFPMDGVEDTLDIPVKNIQHSADGQSFISWRDTVLPFRPLKELLTFNRQIIRGSVYGGTRDDDMVSVIVVRSGNTLIALQIDLVLSEQEIVIKQFEGPAPKPIGVAGATVLGDGRIMPIADVLEIIDIFQGRISKHSGGTLWQQKGTPDVIEIPAVKIDPTVLIVDDSITVRELLSLTFNKAGYRVEQARDGQEAWDKLRSGLPCDIVFCDIEMPRCDGLELLSRIQKDSSLNHLPIAMLTSRGADKHRQMAIQLGASGYFTKPYLEEALLEAAVRMLKGEKLVNSSNG